MGRPKKRGTKKPKSKKASKKQPKTNLFQIVTRYIILLALMFTLPIIYKIFTPLTTYPTAWLLGIFYDVVIHDSMIIIDNQTFVKIIPACVAGSAYLLLLILSLTLPMPLKRRVYSILSAYTILLAINILRIFVFSVWFHTSTPFFDFTHNLFWYGLNIIIVIGIWFLIVRLFSIKEIPVYTDIQTFLKSIKKKK